MSEKDLKSQKADDKPKAPPQTSLKTSPKVSSKTSSQEALKEKESKRPSREASKKGTSHPGEEKRGWRKKAAPKKKQISPVSDFEERVVSVNRVAKVVKGGRRFSFSALIIVGDKNGKVGYGLGKAKEVPEAIKKAIQMAQRKMITVPIDNGTIPHRIIGTYNAGKILFRPASEGTGVKAAGACRSILELAGVRNVLTKSLRGNNPHNIVKATFHAMKNLRSVGEVAELRGLDPKKVRLSQ